MPYFASSKGQSWLTSSMTGTSRLTPAVMQASLGFSKFDRAVSTRPRSRKSKVQLNTALKPASVRIKIADAAADPYGYFCTSTAEASQKRLGLAPLADTGHSFYRVDINQIPNSLYATRYQNSTPYVYQNLCLIADGVDRSDLLATFDTSSLESFGQTAISKKMPKRSDFSLGEFLGELREGLPSPAGLTALKSAVSSVPQKLRHQVVSGARSSGSEYLNYQFGIAPLLSDVQKIARIVLNAEQSLATLRKDQFRPIYRRYSLPSVTTSNVVTNVTSLNGYYLGTPMIGCLDGFPLLQSDRNRLFSSFNIGNGSVYIGCRGGYYARTTERKRWFEGSFTAAFDIPSPSVSYAEKALFLLRPGLTVQDLWELAPWSWLVDWIFSIQSTISSNQSYGDEKIVMNYGYAMERVLLRVTCSATATNFGSYTVTSDPRLSYVQETRLFRRIRANPFGFTISSPGQLSAGQVAILAALGLSRS